MPAQVCVSKSALDPINLLLIGAAIAITFLPVTITLLFLR